MRKVKNNLLKEVAIHGLRLKEDDVLVIKYPTDEDGIPTYDFDILSSFHKGIAKTVKCDVISIPDSIELQRIRKEDILISNKKKRQRRFI